MPIEVEVLSARRQRIHVEVVPPRWQEFIFLDSEQDIV